MLPTYLDFKIKILKGHLKFWRFFKLVWKFSRLIEVWVDLQVFRWKIILEEVQKSNFFHKNQKKVSSEGHHTLFTFDSHFQGNLSNRQTHTFWLTYSSFFTFTTNTCHALNVNTHIFFFLLPKYHFGRLFCCQKLCFWLVYMMYELYDSSLMKCPVDSMNVSCLFFVSLHILLERPRMPIESQETTFGFLNASWKCSKEKKLWKLNNSGVKYLIVINQNKELWNKKFDSYTDL